MDCRLTVLSTTGMKQWNVNDWTAGAVLAALSADPTTLDELLSALRRYQPKHKLGENGRELDDLHAAAGHDMWCLVDLRGKTAVGGGQFEMPDPQGAYEATATDQCDGFPIIWMDTPNSWLFLTESDDWPSQLAARVAAAELVSPIDTRQILFGAPLCQFLARQVQAAHTAHPHADEERRWETTQAIHADWLMTARQELGDRTPREVLLADRNRIQLDLEHRSDQWGQQGFPPVPLAVDSHAYRYGGFGTAEVVIYFDLIRSMLAKAWQLVTAEPQMSEAALAWQLSEHREQWLEQPFEERGSQSARAIIESERRRLPMTSDGRHYDCDCPICQAEADGQFGSSPMFMWFDGHHLELEDKFAFSMYESYQEWQKYQSDFGDC